MFAFRNHGQRVHNTGVANRYQHFNHLQISFPFIINHFWTGQRTYVCKCSTFYRNMAQMCFGQVDNYTFREWQNAFKSESKSRLMTIAPPTWNNISDTGVRNMPHNIRTGWCVYRMGWRIAVEWVYKQFDCSDKHIVNYASSVTEKNRFTRNIISIYTPFLTLSWC